MERQRTTALPAEAELARQMEYIREIRQENDRYFAETGKHKKFYSLAMGCQMNAHDSEKLEGMLDEMATNVPRKKQKRISSSTIPAVSVKMRS